MLKTTLPTAITMVGSIQVGAIVGFTFRNHSIVDGFRATEKPDTGNLHLRID